MEMGVLRNQIEQRALQARYSTFKTGNGLNPF
jgi:hypothetical protein